MCLSYREIKNVEVVVRKPHMCAWCGETISGKERAQSRVYTFDGEFTHDWMHPECYAAMLNSPPDAYCDGFMPGDFDRGISNAH